MLLRYEYTALVLLCVFPAAVLIGQSALLYSPSIAYLGHV